MQRYDIFLTCDEKKEGLSGSSFLYLPPFSSKKHERSEFTSAVRFTAHLIGGREKISPTKSNQSN